LSNIETFGYPPHWANWLLNCGAARDEREAETLLRAMRAIESDDEATFASMLDEGLDPSAKLFDGWDSLLLAAIERGRSDAIVLRLLERGAAVDPSKMLVLAVARHGPAVAAKLVERGCDVNEPKDYPPLLTAVWSGNVEMVKQLIDLGAKVNAKCEVYPSNKKVTGHTPLMVAAGNSDLAMVKFLLACGAEVSPADSSGRTALDYAAKKKSKRAQPVTAVLSAAGAVSMRSSAPRPDFASNAKSESFQQLLARLAELTGKKPAAVELEEGKLKGAAAFAVKESQAREMLQRVRSEPAPKPYTVFISRDVMRRSGWCIVALPTSDIYEAVAAMQTAGPNAQVGNDDVIAWLKETAKETPFEVIEIMLDSLRAALKSSPPDAVPLAHRINKLCPDGDDGDGADERLAQHIRQTGEMFLWWD
jgi:ankyrin repeat protein